MASGDGSKTIPELTLDMVLRGAAMDSEICNTTCNSCNSVLSLERWMAGFGSNTAGGNGEGMHHGA